MELAVLLCLEKVSQSRFKQYRRSRTEPVGLGDIYPINLACIISEEGIHYVLLRFLPDNMVVGSMSFRHQIRGIRTSKLLEVEISEEYRGRGWGSIAIGAFIREAINFGSIFASLVVFNDKRAARHIYEKLGFISIETFQNSQKMILPLFGRHKN